jgi:hypothetical protein
MASSQKNVTTWRNTYRSYNRTNKNDSSIRPLNLSLAVVRDVFSKITFNNKESCSNIKSNWPSGLVKLYPETPSFLSEAEFTSIKPEILSKFLANVNERDLQNNTALSYAVKRNNLNLVKYLLSSKKVHTAIKDDNGQTPLHYAVANTNNPAFYKEAFEIIRLLIEENPALPNIKDNSDKGPGNKEYALKSEIRQYIKSKKSSMFSKKKNTNKMKAGSKRKTLNKKREKR